MRVSKTTSRRAPFFSSRAPLALSLAVSGLSPQAQAERFGMSRDTLQTFYVKFSAWCACKVHVLSAESFMPGFDLDWANVASLNAPQGAPGC